MDLVKNLQPARSIERTCEIQKQPNDVPLRGVPDLAYKAVEGILSASPRNKPILTAIEPALSLQINRQAARHEILQPFIHSRKQTDWPPGALILRVPVRILEDRAELSDLVLFRYNALLKASAEEPLENLRDNTIGTFKHFCRDRIFFSSLFFFPPFQLSYWYKWAHCPPLSASLP